MEFALIGVAGVVGDAYAGYLFRRYEFRREHRLRAYEECAAAFMEAVTVGSSLQKVHVQLGDAMHGDEHKAVGILTSMLPFLTPMLATTGGPAGVLDGWMVEPKLDGWRCQIAIDRDGIAVRTRTGRDVTANVPELAPLASLGVDCVLDGEIVAGAGLPAEFYPLAGVVSSRWRRQPLTFVAFDVLHVGGDRFAGVFALVIGWHVHRACERPGEADQRVP